MINSKKPKSIQPNILIKIKILTLCLLAILISSLHEPNLSAIYYEKANAFYYTRKNNLDSSLIFARKALPFYSEKKDYTKLIELQTLICRIFYEKQQIDSAEFYLRLAETLSVKENRIHPFVYELKGILYASREKDQEALTYYNKSIHLIDSGMRIYAHAKPRILRYKGNVLYGQAKYNDALSIYNLAKTLSEKGNDYAEMAKSSHCAGLCYYMKGEFNKALLNFNLVLKLTAQYEIYDNYDKALLFSALGNIYSHTGYLNLAIELFQKAEVLLTNELGSMNPLLIDLYEHYGEALFISKEYDRACNYFKKAIALIESIKGHNQYDIITAWYYLGQIEIKKQNFEAAMNYFRIAEKHPKVQDHFLSISILEGVGMVYFYQGDQKKAEQYYRKALNKKISANGFYSLPSALIYIRISNLYYQLNSFNKVIDFSKTAINILNKIKSNKTIVIGDLQLLDAYYLLSDSYLKVGAADSAIETVNKAIQIAIPGYTDKAEISKPEYKEIRKSLLLVDCFFVKGKSLLYKYKTSKNLTDLEKALNCLQYGIEIFMEIRTSYFLLSDQLHITNDFQELFKNAVFVCMQLKKLTNDKKYDAICFNIIEKNKASVLLSGIKNAEAKIQANIPDSLQYKEQKIDEEIQSLKNLLYKENRTENPPPDYLKEIENELFSKEKEKEMLVSLFEKSYPDYYRLKYDTDVIPIDKTIKKISKNDVILEYFFADSILTILAISRDEIIWKNIKTDSLLLKDIESINNLMNPLVYLEKPTVNFKNFIICSHRLYNCLIKPIENTIQNKDLIIIADPAFSGLSFEILCSENSTNTTSFEKLPFLIKTNNISYAYSSSLYFTNANNSHRFNQMLYAFAFSEPDSIADNRISKPLFRVRNKYYPLAGAREEVLGISGLMSSKIFMGRDATEKNFKNCFKKQGIIHLAMHTHIDDNNPMYSKLIFHTSDSSEDGLLNAYELYNLKTKISMAVLSACKTGFGKNYKGEGMMSLARAFLFAGCPSVIMTLWLVEDKSSAQLMVYFYKNLISGKSKTESLRLAKLKILETSDQLHTHPYFWAGYLLIGNKENIFNQYPATFKLVFSIVLLVIIFFILFYFK